MASLKWEDVPAQTSPKAQPTVGTGNPWFGVTMGLLGIIVGYILANVLH